MPFKLGISKRLSCSKSELKYKVLKTFALKRCLEVSVRWNIAKRFFNSYYQNRLVNSCNSNGKSRAVFRCFRLNRLAIAAFQAQGYLKNINKASW